jgi:hypothetical protein
MYGPRRSTAGVSPCCQPSRRRFIVFSSYAQHGQVEPVSARVSSYDFTKCLEPSSRRGAETQRENCTGTAKRHHPARFCHSHLSCLSLRLCVSARVCSCSFTECLNPFSPAGGNSARKSPSGASSSRPSGAIIMTLSSPDPAQVPTTAGKNPQGRSRSRCSVSRESPAVM